MTARRRRSWLLILPAYVWGSMESMSAQNQEDAELKIKRVAAVSATSCIPCAA